MYVPGLCGLRVLAVVFVALAAAAQDSADKASGVWKLSSEKSNWPGPNAPTSAVMSIEKVSQNAYRESFDVMTSAGQKIHVESIRTYDGKERPVPDSPGLTETCELLDASTNRCTEKRNGNVVLEMLSRISDDGKSDLVQRTQVTADGRLLSGLVVYEKQ